MLISDSHIEFIDLCLKTSLGTSWKSLFKIILCDTRPALFNTSQSPFYSLDACSTDLKGKAILDI